MLRRTFNWSTPGSLLALCAALSGCTTASSSDASRTEQMDKRRTIDAGVDSMLARLYDIASWCSRLCSTSASWSAVNIEGALRVARTHGRLLQHGDLDTSTTTGEVNAFVLTNHGLMAGASLEGTKVTRLASL